MDDTLVQEALKIIHLLSRRRNDPEVDDAVDVIIRLLDELGYEVMVLRDEHS